MMRLLLLFAIMPCFALSGANQSMAQDNGSDERPAQEENAKTVKSDDAEDNDQSSETQSRLEVHALNEKLGELTMNLNENDRRHFYTLYNNNNLISTVKYVRNHIGEAIDACSENNPDMEDDLRARYKKWTDAVNEKLIEAEAQVENMVLVQEYVSDEAINAVLKQADDLRAKTQENVKRIPVTSPEACEYLLNKMDETQATMLGYLGTVLVAMPQAMDVPQSPAE